MTRIMNALSSILAPAPSGGRLVSTAGTELPLVGAQINTHAVGGFARVELEQTFVNTGSVALDVTYQVPLPADGAVSGYRFTLGSTVVVGEVHPKQQARERFEKAVAAGHTAALLEEERTSLFTQSIGNLPPGERLVVHVSIDQPLLWTNGGWEWRFPTVVAPRYLGGLDAASAAVLQVDVSTDDVGARFGAALVIRDALTGAVESPSHQPRVEEGIVSIAGAKLNRDVVVRWPVAAPEPGVSLHVGRGRSAEDSKGYARLTLVPPALRPDVVVGRDLVVLVDVSGSMGGEPLRQARVVLDALVAELGEHDQLELLKFCHSVERWRSQPVAVTPANQTAARRWIGALKAGGATEMYTGICEALTRKPREGTQRQVLIVTDGYIGRESAIVQRILLERPGSTRVHTLGVGSSVNRTLTEWVARAGGGLEQIIEPRAEATEAVTHLMARTAAPLVVDVRVSGSALVDGAPFRTPDLFAGSPATLHLRTVPEGGTLHVKGMGAHGEWCVEIAVPPAPSEDSDRSLAACWARQRVDDLELSRLSQQNVPAIDAAITELGVDYQISTRLTSWVAVSKRSTVDGLAPKRTITQPQEVPANVSIENFGLRGALQEAPSGYGGAVDKRLGTRGAAPARARSQRVKEQIQQAELSWDEDDAEEGLSVHTLGEATRSRGLPPERKAKKRGPAGPPRPAPKSMPAPVQETVEANATDGASPQRPPLYVPQGTPSEEDGLMGGNPMMLPMLLVALLTSPVWLPIAGVVWLVRALLNWVRRDG